MVRGARFRSFMSSIMRRRSGVMVHSSAEVDGTETALIMAQRECSLISVKQMTGERRGMKGDQGVQGKSSKFTGGRRDGPPPRSGLVQPVLSCTVKFGVPGRGLEPEWEDALTRRSLIN